MEPSSLNENSFFDKLGMVYEPLWRLDITDRTSLRATNKFWQKKVDEEWHGVKVQIGLPEEINFKTIEDVKILFSNMQHTLSRSSYFSKVKVPVTIYSAKCLYQYFSMRAKASLLEMIVNSTDFPCDCLKGIKQKAYAIWNCKDNPAKAIFSNHFEHLATIDKKLTECVSDPDVINKITDLSLPRKSIYILPLQILKLTNLTSLDLYHNDLLFVPKELTNLQKLTLKNNPALPKELSEKVQHDLSYLKSELKNERRNDLYDLESDSEGESFEFPDS